MMSTRPIVTLSVLLATLAVTPGATAQNGPEPLVVRHVRFTGNEHISDRSLRLAIATSQGSFMARAPVLRALGLGGGPRFDQREFRRDVLRIQALYGVRGFPRAVVDTVVTRSGKRVDVEFLITENAPIRVEQIALEGVPATVPQHRLMAALPLAAGAPFDRLAYQSARVVIETTLRDYGYAFATVEGRFTLDADDGTVVVVFAITPGPKATVGDIEIVGAVQIDERVIRQTMTIRSGDPFSEQALYDSQLALFRSSLFTFVHVGLADSAPVAAPSDSVVTVRVRAQVMEGALREARLGAGYGTRDCFRTRAGLELLNFTGGGRRLELVGRLSQIGTGTPLAAGFEHSVCPALADEDQSRLKLNYHIGATLREPLLFSRRTTARLSAFAERHTEIRAFLRETVRGEISVTQDLGRDLPLTLTYALSFGKTDAEPATFCVFFDICRVEDTQVFAERRRRSVLSLDFSRNTTNSVNAPRRGTVFLGSVGWASQVIGSDTLTEFLRAEAEFSSYHRLIGRSVLAWRVRAGAVVAPVRILEGGRRRFVPPEERFYAGGPNSVRGFSQNELGPVTRVLEAVDTLTQPPDSTIRTSASGAEQLLLANLELRFPLPLGGGGLTGLVFADAGLVGDRGAFSLDDVRITPGIGARLGTPIGPVGLDIAVNPYPPQEGRLYRAENGDLTLVQEAYRPRRSFLDRFRIHFSVGQSF